MDIGGVRMETPKKLPLVIVDEVTEVLRCGFSTVVPKEEGRSVIDLRWIDFKDYHFILKDLPFFRKVRLLLK